MHRWVPPLNKAGLVWTTLPIGIRKGPQSVLGIGNIIVDFLAAWVLFPIHLLLPLGDTRGRTNIPPPLLPQPGQLWRLNSGFRRARLSNRPMLGATMNATGQDNRVKEGEGTGHTTSNSFAQGIPFKL
jgi:hypothetical protein